MTTPAPSKAREAGFLAYGEHFWDNRYSTKASIDSITREDIESFHNKWFVPAEFRGGGQRRF